MAPAELYYCTVRTLESISQAFLNQHGKSSKSVLRVDMVVTVVGLRNLSGIVTVLLMYTT